MTRVDIENLKNLDGVDKLAEIFSRILDYEYVGTPISTRRWKERVVESIVDLDIELLAKHMDFHIIRCRMGQLRLGLERAIITQLLNEHPYSLVIFSDTDFRYWHFVNVKYDPETRNRRLFRRIAIGPDERLHTAAQRINMLEVIGERVSPLELQIRHDKAFDIEEVTREFYEKYTQVLRALSDDIAEENPGEDTNKEAQIILDRLLFLYFVQKKGWLDNNRRYLHENFLTFWKKDPKGNSFYSDFLVKLFQALSSRDNRFKDTLGDVPFLNGGLFEVSPFFSDLPFRLVIRNDTFRNIFDCLLERFNFTVREDTPLDVEVAIDPEMLGKIFENLILKLEKGEDLRRKTGSYYTPRAIVHFMCKESFKEYLIAQSSVDRARIEWLLAMNPAEQLTAEEMQELQGNISVSDAELLRDLTKKAYVCDPAVGSGAFLVGMLHEMSSVLKLLDLRQFGQRYIERPNYGYEKKRELIESCLYGVDVQDQAVRICELRLWLSLIVEYERQRDVGVPPLPNLTYKIRCGDSVIEKLFGYNVRLDQLVQTDDGRRLIDEIAEDKHRFFLLREIADKNRIQLTTLVKQCELMQLLIKEKQKSLSGPQLSFLEETVKERRAREELQRTKRQYENLRLSVSSTRRQVERMLKGRIPASTQDIHDLGRRLGVSFVWKLDFAEAFKEKGGFDVVIANPPYISFGLRDVGKAKGEWADYIRRNYPNSAEYKLSIYAIFMDKGIQLLKDRGVLCYITPDSFLLGRYFSKLRNLVLHSCKVREIVMFEQDFWRGGVVGRPVITNIQKESNGSARLTNRLTAALCTKLESIETVDLQSYSYEQKYFEQTRHKRFRLFFSETALAYVQAVERHSFPLGQIAGITTGVRSKIGQQKIIAREPKDEFWKKGIISGTQVQPFTVRWKGHYLNIKPDLLWAGGWDRRIVENPKLMMRQTGDSLIVGIDRDGLYHLNNVHSISLRNQDCISLECLCAVLNSRLMNRYYHLISLEKDRTMAQTDIETLEALPMRVPRKDIQNTIEQLVRANLGNTEATEALDNCICEVYELPDELRDYLKKASLY